jgi:RHS repeat-associated protein
VQSRREFNLRYQMTRAHVYSPTLTYLDQSYVYDYRDGAPGPTDPGPNLDELIDHQDASQSRFFFYDELDRLWKATDLSGSPLFTYTYDGVGNRSEEDSPAGTTTYAYEAGTDRLASATGAKARQYAHDAFGNRIWAGATPYAGTPSLRYNESNRLVEADDPANPTSVLGQYTYDAFGRRVQKTAGGITTVYLYDLSGHLVESVNTSALPNVVRDALYLEDELVAVVDQVANVGASTLPLLRRPLPPLSPRGWALLLTGSAGLLLLLGAGASRRPRAAEAGFALVALAVLGGACGGTAISIVWVHTDYLGKPLVVTNTPTDGSAPAKIWTASYEPYGLASPNTDPSDTGNPFTLDFRFQGQLYDAETGMHYNSFRDYDSTTGRFLESDPLGMPATAYDSAGWTWTTDDPIQVEDDQTNRYTYAGQDPANWIDPSGLWHCVGNAVCDFTPPMTEKLDCFDKCRNQRQPGADTRITGGREGHDPDDPHSSGDAVDIGRTSNSDLCPSEARRCFDKCFMPDGYGQEEYNSRDNDPGKGTHYHLQDRPGLGGATNFAPGIKPHGRRRR